MKAIRKITIAAAPAVARTWISAHHGLSTQFDRSVVNLSVNRSRAGSRLRGTLALIVASGVMHLSGAARAQADFEGIWTVNTPLGTGGPREDEIRYTPAGRAEWEEFNAEIDPSFRCIMPGIPRGFTDPYPIEIIQQDHQIVILHEYYHQVRRIFMDGREAPDYWPTTLGGYSTGHWEGETLVVRTTRLSPDNLMDIHGRPFSGAEDTYVIERYTRDGDLLSRIAEVHDPTYYEEPFVANMEWKFAPDGEIWEYACDPQFGDVGPGGAIQGGTEAKPGGHDHESQVTRSQSLTDHPRHRRGRPGHRPSQHDLLRS